jgi:glycosyltransferase involved in cell wall biosynthesis
MSFDLVLIHPMDPRGAKVGGIETHVRQLVRLAPRDARLIFVGVDAAGDLPIGRVTPVSAEGRVFDLLPILAADDRGPAAATVAGSLTFRFTLALARALPRLRALLAHRPASIEVERYEFAALARAAGKPVVVFAHNEGARGDKQDSLVGRHFWAHEAAEWLALRAAARVFCVTERLEKRLVTRHPGRAHKVERLTVSVDARRFRPTPLPPLDGPFRLVFAGRLDAFKDPALLFAASAEIARRLGGAFELHYAGPSDPAAFPAFAAAAPHVTRHGVLVGEAVADLLRRSHGAILTSLWEGMPCALLEALASGRPATGVRLPQFGSLVVEGVSGRMAQRPADPAEAAGAVADAALALRADLLAHRLDPERIAALAAPFSAERQLGRLVETHRRLALGGPAAEPSPAAA